MPRPQRHELIAEQIQNPEDVRAERGYRSLAYYYKNIVWPFLEPGKKLADGWYLDLMAEYIEAVFAHEITRLMVCLPPRFGKSNFVTIAAPTWAWIHDPTMRFLFVSHSGDLSEEHSVKRRDIITSEWYRHYWGADTELATNKVDDYTNVSRGRMCSTSVGGSVLGKGGNIILDDPLDPRVVYSDTKRHTANELVTSTLPTRLDDLVRGFWIVVGHRLHIDDTHAHLLSRGKWELLELDILPSEPRTYVFPRSGRVVRQEADEPLCPERAGKTEIATLEEAAGPYNSAAQLHQRPVKMGGRLIDPQWWIFWHYPGAPLPAVEVEKPDGETAICQTISLPAEWDEQFQSWDMAFQGKSTSDFVAGGEIGRLGVNLFLLDLAYEQMDIIQTMESVRAMLRRWPQTRRIVIEAKAVGPVVMDMLQSEIDQMEGYDPRQSKQDRVHAVIPAICRHEVVLPHPDLFDWVDELLKQCAGLSKHDDIRDMLVQAILVSQSGLAEAELW